jgi:hypothetical protein
MAGYVLPNFACELQNEPNLINDSAHGFTPTYAAVKAPGFVIAAKPASMTRRTRPAPRLRKGILPGGGIALLPAVESRNRVIKITNEHSPASSAISSLRKPSTQPRWCESS